MHTDGLYYLVAFRARILIAKLNTEKQHPKGLPHTCVVTCSYCDRCVRLIYSPTRPIQPLSFVWGLFFLKFYLVVVCAAGICWTNISTWVCKLAWVRVCSGYNHDVCRHYYSRKVVKLLCFVYACACRCEFLTLAGSYVNTNLFKLCVTQHIIICFSSFLIPHEMQGNAISGLLSGK